jgi:uncharacterized protein
MELWTKLDIQIRDVRNAMKLSIKNLLENSKKRALKWREWAMPYDKATSETKRVDLKRISQNEFTRLCDEHSLWLSTKGKEGNRAIFQRICFDSVELTTTDLSRAVFQDVVIVLSDFTRSKLKDCTFSKVEWRLSKLDHADFSGTNLEDEVSFSETTVRHADFSLARGLSPYHFAGADTTGVKFPEQLSFTNDLEDISQSTKYARIIFLTLLAASVFTWLTVGSTSDLNLLNEKSATSLPIIQTKVPLAHFYRVIPFFIFFLFVYFHLYIRRIWRTFRDLPLVFPDGRRAVKKVDPWLLSPVYHGIRFSENPLFDFLRRVLEFIALWVIIPVTLLLIWLRYLPLRDLSWSFLQLSLFLVTVLMSGVFYISRLDRSHRITPNPYEDQAKLRNVSYYAVKYSCTALFALAAAFLVTHDAINGIPGVHRGGEPLGSPGDSFHYLKTLSHRWKSESTGMLQGYVAALFRKTGYGIYLDLSNEEVAKKPADWVDSLFGESSEKQISKVPSVDLFQQDLRYAYMPRAFLVRANLTRSNLKGASLAGSDLRSAKLTEVILTEAHLDHAKLSHTNLRGANLERASLRYTNLRGADLSNAILAEADFTGADVTAAVFKQRGTSGVERSLKNVDLSRVVGLTTDQLEGCCGDESSKLPHYLRNYVLPRCIDSTYDESSNKKKSEEIDRELELLNKVGEAYKRNDLQTAFRHSLESAEMGYKASQFLVGLMFRDGEGVQQDLSKAARWLNKAATNGDVDASLVLGEMYLNGQEEFRDLDKALLLLESAADNGKQRANTLLAEMYLNGKGVKEDVERAVRLLQVASEAGETSAQFRLGKVYMLGKGVPQDYLEAHVLFNLANAGGEEEVAEEISKLERRMDSSIVAEAQALAKKRWHELGNK